MSKITHVTVSATGLGWFTFWMFTIAYAHLGWGDGAWALIAWPYYLGQALSR